LQTKVKEERKISTINGKNYQNAHRPSYTQHYKRGACLEC